MIRVRNGGIASVSIAGTILADITDRAGRLLGVVNSITNSVSITQAGPFIVTGQAAEGAAATGNPVRTAGVDGG